MIAYTGDLKWGMYTSAPLGWKLCDGTGGTPDFRARMPLGKGSGSSVGDTGGASSVTVPLPQHDHDFTGGSHTHGFSGGSHTHGFSGGSHSHGTFPTLGNTSGPNVQTSSGNTGWRAFSTTTSGTQSATAGGTVAAANAGGTVAAASTSGTVGNAGVSNASISTLSPYVVCLAIIKV